MKHGSPASSGEPAGQTRYSAWLQTDALRSLQRTVTDHPGEFGFIVAAQVSELWATLIVTELQAAQKLLRADKPTDAARTLRRVVAHFGPLNATWRSIAWMSPTGMRAMLSQVSATPGEDTPFQGRTYRQLCCLLGVGQTAALAETGIYDDVLAYFCRVGLSVPSRQLERDPGTPHVPDRDVEQIWRDIYEDPYPDAPLQQLGDALAEIAEAFVDWHYRHSMATRRMSWGQPIPFPELWSARGSSALR